MLELVLLRNWNDTENLVIDTQSLSGPSTTRSTMKALGTRLGFRLIAIGSQINNNHLNKEVYNDARHRNDKFISLPTHNNLYILLLICKTSFAGTREWIRAAGARGIRVARIRFTMINFCKSTTQLRFLFNIWLWGCSETKIWNFYSTVTGTYCSVGLCMFAYIFFYDLTAISQTIIVWTRYIVSNGAILNIILISWQQVASVITLSRTSSSTTPVKTILDIA